MKKSRTSKMMALLLTLILVLSLLPPLSVAAEDYTEDFFYAQYDEELTLIDEEMLNVYGLERLVPSQFAIENLTGLVGFYGYYALDDTSDPVSVIVVFRSNPAPVQVKQAEERGMRITYNMAAAIAEGDHSLFRRELADLFSSPITPFGTDVQSMSYTITHEFRNYLNGVAITMPQNMVAYLAAFESVVTVKPNVEIEIGPFDFEVFQAAVAYADDMIRNPQGMAVGRDMMRADAMHGLGFMGQGVVVAVIDSGIDIDHPAFRGAFLTYEEMMERMDSIHGAGNHNFSMADTMYRHGNHYFFGRNFRLEDRGARNNPNELLLEVAPALRSSHGTHVAGTIVARDTGGDIAALGVAPEAHVIAYRVFNRTGGFAADMLASFEMIMYDRPDVVNMSFGVTRDNNPMSSVAIAVTNIALLHPNIVLVNSMGNSGSDNGNDNNRFFSGTSPAQSTPVISVGAFEHEIDRTFTLHSGGMSMLADMYFDSAISRWTSLPSGRYVTSFNPDHVNGVYRMLAMPNTVGATFYLPPPSAPGIPHPRQSLGAGTQADFEALAEKYGDELAGAFVLVRRGIGWGDLQDRAIEFGIAGILNVNDFRPLPTRLQSMGRNEVWYVPGLFVPHAQGVALYDSLVDGRGTFHFTDFTASPPTIAFFSSIGPVNMTFENNNNIGAHGHWVISTVPPAAIPELGDHDYARAYAANLGTSMSAPHVAGAAALMIQYSREVAGRQWTSYEIKTRMMNTAIPVGQGVLSVFQIGAGYVDVFAAAHADHFVMVEYDKVPWQPLSGTPFWEQDFETAMTGSFSFNSRRMYMEDEDFHTRRLTATIVNESSEARAYTISHRWTCHTHPSGLVQNPVGNVVLHTSTSTVVVPANSTGNFDVWMQISPGADFWFYEGFVDVYHAGSRVAALPFAFLAEAPSISDFRLVRPVISTGPYALHGASSVLEAVFTPNMGYGFDVWIFRDNEITADMNEINWRTEERFREALVGFSRQALINQNAMLPGRPERMSVFDGWIVPSRNEAGELVWWPGAKGATVGQPGAGSGLPGTGVPRQLLEEEGDFIIMLDTYRQVDEVQFLIWLIPIYSNWIDIDIMARFSVDNTPPELEVNHEVQGNDVRIFGNAKDLWLSQAMARGVNFDVWLPGSQYGPQLGIQNNLAVFANTPNGTVRVPIDPQGNFDHTLADVMEHEVFEILVWAIDNYSITPRISHTLLQPLNIWSSAAEFSYPGGPLARADRALNQFVRTAHLAGYVPNDAFNDFVWVGSNFAEVRIPFGESLLYFELLDSGYDPVTPSSIPSVEVSPGRFIAEYLPDVVPTRQYGVFTGWGIRVGEDIVPVTGEMRMPVESVVIYAMWHPYVLVSFDLNDTAAQPAVPRTIEPVRIFGETPFLASENFPDNPTREDFRFNGWTLGGTLINAGTLVPLEPVTLVANWTTYVQLSFDLRGTPEYPTEPVSIAPITVLSGSIIRNHPQFPANPTRAGDYVFAGWHIDFTLIWNQIVDEIFATFGLPPILRPLVPTPQPGDDLLELLANFIEIAEGFLPPGTIPPGIVILLPTFLPEWMPTVVPDNGMVLVPQDFEMPPVDLTITAYWWRSRELSFITNGGNELAPVMVIEDRKIMDSLFVAPTRDGYVFGGWFVDAGLTQRLTVESMMPRGAKTLYASWQLPQAGVALVSTEAQLRAILPVASGIHTVYLLQSIRVAGATQLIFPNNRVVTLQSHPEVGRTVLTSAITSNNPMITVGVAPTVANRPNVTIRNVGMTRAEGMIRNQHARAITNLAVLTLENVEIYGFAPHLSSPLIGPMNGAVGGAIFNNHAQALLTIRDSRLFNNTQGTGTIHQMAGGTIHVYDTEIFNNISELNAGGISSNAAGNRLFMTRVRIFDNVALNDGGGVQVAATGGNSRMEMWDTYIFNNIAVTGNGGGLNILQNNNHVVMHSGGIFGNSAVLEGFDIGDIDSPITSFETLRGGGGVGLGGNNSSFTMHGGVIRDNIGLIGGGISMHGFPSRLFIYGGEIHGNHSLLDGGGIYTHNGTRVYINGGRIFENTADRHGGGVHFQGFMSFSAEPGSIVGNVPNNITGFDGRSHAVGASGINFDLGGSIEAPVNPATIQPVWVPVNDRMIDHTPSITLTRQGFEFVGWFTDPLRLVPLTDADLMGAELTTLFAGWYGDVLAQTLSFDLGGTDYAPTTPEYLEPILVAVGSIILVAPNFPDEPERDGHYFLGWYLDGEFGYALTDEKAMPEEDITIFANWEAAVVILPTPEAPIVDEEAGLVGWDAVDGSAGYRVYVSFAAYELAPVYVTTVILPEISLGLLSGLIFAALGEGYFSVQVQAVDGDGEVLTKLSLPVNLPFIGTPAVPVPSLDIFNNGEGGSPSRPNYELAQQGIIRMWTMLDGEIAPVYLAAANTVVAFDQSGNCALGFVSVNRLWDDGFGWLEYFVSIDIQKDGGSWQYINFTVTVYGQTLHVLLVNALHGEAPEFATVTFVVENGALGVYAPRTTYVEVPVGEAIPEFLVPQATARAGFYFAGWYPTDPAGFVVEEAVTFTARFNLLWHYVNFDAAPGGELAFVSPWFNPIRIRDGMVFWAYRIPTPVAHDGFAFAGWFLDGFHVEPESFQVVNVDGLPMSLTFVAMFEPVQVAAPTFMLAANEATVTNANRHVSIFALGTAEGPITVSFPFDPQLVITARDNLWTPTGNVYGIVVGVAGGQTVTEPRTVLVEVTRQGVTQWVTVNLLP